MPTTWTEVLPQHKARKRPAMEWTPVDEPSGPVIGHLEIHTARGSCAYRVEEFPADSQGRGICLLKLAPGTDATEDHYSLFVCGRRVTCECRGYVSTGHCKHADSVASMIENKWL